MPNAFDMMVPTLSTTTAADIAAAEDRELLANADLAGAILHVLSSQEKKGDLFGLVRLFEQSSLSRKLQSWIGGRENLSITAEEVKRALGDEFLQSLAKQLKPSAGDGVTIDESTLERVGSVLPVLVRKFTRSGQIPPPRILKRNLEELKKELEAMA